MKKLAYIIILLFLFFSCNSDKASERWITTRNDCMFWGNIAVDTLDYVWNGDCIEGVLQGDGVLQGYDKNNNLIETRKLSAYWGALRKDDFKVSSDLIYLGEIKKSLLNDYSLNGFAVLIKQDDIYIGNFQKNQPDGLLSLYKKGKLHYKGEWKDGKVNGKGTLYKETGEIKSGIWENDSLISISNTVSKTSKGEYIGSIYNKQAEGQGSMKYNDGNYYEGAWSKGNWEGEGLLVTSRNDSVFGEWKESKLTGYGIYKSPNLIYEGDWENNKPNGIGYMYSDLDSIFYSGGWEDGKKNGYGDLIFNDSVSYSGEWLDNKFNGDGIFHYANEEFYDGEWKGSLQHGKGIYNSKDYNYEGEWEEGWMNGSGKMVFSNGDYYEGNFVENERYGTGRYHFIDGNTYEGEFIDNTFNGLGTFHFADGNWYEGEFANGKIQGEGTLYYIGDKDTLAITTEWDGTPQFPNQASILFSNGDLYEGELINGFPTENGNWTTEQDRIKAEKNRSFILKANDFYKCHRDTWNKVVLWTSVALTSVEVAAGAVAVVCPPALAIAGNAHAANIWLNIIDATVAISSAGIDVYEAKRKGEDPTDAIINLGMEVSVNVALIYLPKAVQTPASKAAAKKLGQQAVKRLIELGKNKTFGKVITLVKNSKGVLEKKLVTSKLSIFAQRLAIRGKNQFVTQKTYMKLPKNMADKMILGGEANGNTLRHNLLTAMGRSGKIFNKIEKKLSNKIEKKIAQAHHIVAGNSNTPAAIDARRILDGFKIDYNDARNGIFLPMHPNSIFKGTIHGKHREAYDEYISIRLKSATSQQEVFEFLDDIKRELYNGQLQLLNKHKYNSISNIFKYGTK